MSKPRQQFVPHTPSEPTPAERSEQLAAATKAFLRSGGRVERIKSPKPAPPGPVPAVAY